MRNRTVFEALTAIAFLVVVLQPAAAGGSEESADRGEYVAESGGIISPDEIRVHSYVSQIDYYYPDPEGLIGVTLQTSHARLSTAGQELLLQVGIQGRRGEFESIPPINAAFVFDASGSMGAPDKIDFARASLETLLSRLRPTDIISIIAFADEPEVVLEAARVHDFDISSVLTDAKSVLPEGKADMEAAFREARDQLSVYFRPSYINRIILVSDGLVETGR